MGTWPWGVDNLAHSEWNDVNLQLTSAVRSRSFNWAILDQMSSWRALDRFYKASPIIYGEDELLPVNGWRWRPILSTGPAACLITEGSLKL